MARGEAKLFLFETRVGGQAPARELGLFENPPGIDHVSFLVEDVDALHDELAARGIRTAGSPSDQDSGARAAARAPGPADHPALRRLTGFGPIYETDAHGLPAVSPRPL